MARASVTVDDSQMKVLAANFTPKKVARIIRSETKKTGVSTRKSIVQWVGQKFTRGTISAAELKKKNVHLIKVENGQMVYVEGWRIPVARLKPKERKKGGVSYGQVGGGRNTIREAFFGTKRLGRRVGRQVVYARTTPKSHPITELMGPSVPQLLLGEAGKIEDIRRQASATLHKRLASRIDYELSKKA